jgi:uncharacterized membrane protein YidH (DUF202 family)
MKIEVTRAPVKNIRNLKLRIHQWQRLAMFSAFGFALSAYTIFQFATDKIGHFAGFANNSQQFIIAFCICALLPSFIVLMTAMAKIFRVSKLMKQFSGQTCENFANNDMANAIIK